MFHKGTIDHIQEEKTKAYFIAKKLEDIAIEIDELSEEEKKFIIERIYDKNRNAIVQLCNTIINYLGW
ncbi:hypothetical protein [Crassaminicella profunda]|uniref:hypothetical protein n=1 Tax=Crassaminicella profunda TaxID=1286698 RepID=UPI001CA6DD27|nr:hypothetical protein [Crassaminicella profunda]QZY55641.1 hypothetical protein K7H06_01090 [Crassaminicella profunda]